MSKQRTKGTSFETLVLEAFRTKFPDAHRLGLQGTRDCGDIWIPASAGYVIECKNEASYAGKLSTWLSESEVEAENAVRPYGIAVHKRRGTLDPFRQFVTVDVRTWLGCTRG